MKKTIEDFSFSTSWNWRNGLFYGKTGRELVDEIMALGFHKVELNYRITEEMVHSLLPLVEEGVLSVPSVHNVFPNVQDDTYDTDSLLLGYPDAGKRQVAIELTKMSVDWAHRLNSRAVVIHPGAVELPENRHYDVELKELYRKGKKDSPEYKALFQEMLDYRDKHKAPHLERIKRSLEEIGEYISKRGWDITLGIENRAMCHQIPVFDEVLWLLDGLKGCPVGFWYDIGHGVMMESLGLFNNLEVVDRLKEHICGIHVHDALGVDDHFSPYTQSDVLDDFLDLLNDESIIKVLELGKKNSREDILRGVKLLDEKRQSNKTTLQGEV